MAVADDRREQVSAAQKRTQRHLHEKILQRDHGFVNSVLMDLFISRYLY